ncbi:reverse transcriptase-like protein [Streptococcus anginosus]|nr:reverse transcriptase-like protein [Streptococcus anginosus]
MASYVEEVRKLERKFKGLRFEYVKRKDNFAVDELVKMVAERRKFSAGVFCQK